MLEGCIMVQDCMTPGGFMGHVQSVLVCSATHLDKLLLKAPHVLLGFQSQALRVFALAPGVGGLLPSSVQGRHQRCLPGRGRLRPLICRPLFLTCICEMPSAVPGL